MHQTTVSICFTLENLSAGLTFGLEVKLPTEITISQPLRVPAGPPLVSSFLLIKIEAGGRGEGTEDSSSGGPNTWWNAQIKLLVPATANASIWRVKQQVLALSLSFSLLK